MSTDASSGSPWIALPVILLIVGITVAIVMAVNGSPDLFVIILIGTSVVCLPWLIIASNRPAMRNQADAATPPPMPASPPPLPPSYQKVATDAQMRRAQFAASEALLREEKRVARLLNDARCFYKNEGEQTGPVSFWRVRELIEMDLLTPDVQVIAEGSDYWRTYAEWEFIVVPPRDQTTFAKLSKAAHMTCFYLDEGQEIGPISLLGIFHYIRSGKFPAEVQIRAAGDQNWVSASQI
jgi:uncharacterized protein DUF4339